MEIVRSVISEKDPLLLNTFNDVISEIESSLFNLKHLAVETEFSNAGQRQNYNNNVALLKCFYERAESIISL